MSGLEGRTAIVTGASRGIGLAIAAALVDRGANVCITARRREALEEAAASLGAPDRTLPVAGEAADSAHREDAVERTVERFGRVDVLVNNTGVNHLHGPLVDAPLDDVESVIRTNLLGTLGWSQVVHRRSLAEHGGAIVNVASVTGLRPAPMLGAYAVSKAAILHLSRQLAVELAPRVRVNAVAPALVRTRFASPLFAAREDDAAADYPLARLGVPEDVGSAVAFLVSDDAAWITGETFVLDGGLLQTGGVEG